MEKFYSVFTLLILFAVIMTITSFNPIHSVFWLVVVFVESASLLLSLGFEFLGLMLIIIYVGAIAILFLFVIMMLDILQLSKITRIYHVFPLLGIILTQLYFSNINILGYISNPQSIISWDFDYKSQIHMLGGILYSDYGLPFIIISILLLIAMVGAIVLTLEAGIITRKQYLSDQHHRNNSWT